MHDDPDFLRKQAAKCRRLALGLSEREPARMALLHMADEFDLQAMPRVTPLLGARESGVVVQFKPPEPDGER